MLALHSTDIIFFSPIMISFNYLWIGYIHSMSNNMGSRTFNKDPLLVRKKVSFIRSSINSLANWSMGICIIYWIFFYIYKGNENLIWGSHLHFSNFSYGMVFYSGILSLLTQAGVSNILILTNSSISSDYTLSLVQLGLYLPFIHLSNTLLTLFFFMEGASILIFYNLINTKGIDLKNLENSNNSQSRGFFNILFFHFWTSFFSAALTFYGILNFYLLFGTTEWAYLNLLISVSLNSMSLQIIIIVFFSFVCWLIGFLIKLGLAPFFIYKVEIYKGLPLASLIFYSLLYFSIFGSILLVIGSYYFGAASFIIRPIIVLFGFISASLILTIFETKTLRNFFALSSILTMTNFFITLGA